jgi:hypothetical protein
MIGMIGWVCRVGWALRPCYWSDSYDSYDRLGMLIRLGFTPTL